MLIIICFKSDGRPLYDSLLTSRIFSSCLQPVKAAASPLEQSISQPTNSPVPDEVEEIASISEVIPTDTSGSSQGETLFFGYVDWGM